MRDRVHFLRETRSVRSGIRPLNTVYSDHRKCRKWPAMAEVPIFRRIGETELETRKGIFKPRPSGQSLRQDGCEPGVLNQWPGWFAHWPPGVGTDLCGIHFPQGLERPD